MFNMDHMYLNVNSDTFTEHSQGTSQISPFDFGKVSVSTEVISINEREICIFSLEFTRTRKLCLIDYEISREK